MLSRACTLSHSWMVRSSGLALLPVLLEKISSSWMSSRSSRLLFMSQVLFTREDSYDQMLLKDLVRKFLLQQRNQVTFESSESDSRVIHSPDSLQESSAQGASSVPSAEGASSSDQGIPQGIPHPPGLPQPPRRRITGKQPPSEFEVNMITSLKQGILEINQYSVNSDQREEDQELQLLQDLRLQEWYQGDLQGYSEKEVKEAIKKELISLSSVGHEVYDPVPLSLLSSEDQANSEDH